jgi:hypothetical protein
MTVNRPRFELYQPTTLRAAHEFVTKVMPAPTAQPAEWLEFRRRSAAVYARVADVDRGHHHEALYWAERELKVAEELVEQIKADAKATRGRKAGTDVEPA